MILQAIKKSPLLSQSFVGRLLDQWVQKKAARILPHLHPKDKILDIGSGNGLLAQQLLQQGHQVKTVDVEQHSIVENLSTIVYDGQHLPFEDDTFDSSLLLTVLHHTTDPLAVLREAKRVSRKIIIIEDVYQNQVQKYLTFAMDTLVNLGHSNMTYQNRSTKEWQHIFGELGLILVETKEKRVLLFFRQVLFVVQKRIAE